MHIYLAKSSWFESTDFAPVMIDDVGCSRRHQCPQCERSHSPMTKGSIQYKTQSYQYKAGYIYTMMTSSNGNIFRVTGRLCGEFTGHQWISRTKASNAELWFFFDPRLKKLLGKHSRRRWLETSWRSLWRHCNVISRHIYLESVTVTCSPAKHVKWQRIQK